MKTIQVADATNTQLDWLVAKALGHKLKIRTWVDITDTLDPVEDADIIAHHKERNTIRVSAEQIPGGGWFPNPRYSTDWAVGGPILDREGIFFSPLPDKGIRAYRFINHEYVDIMDCWPYRGPITRLIVGTRCFVASRLGGTVEVPEELT